MEQINRNRIVSLDLLRGLVIVLMALDHVRDYFHYDAFFFDPTDVSQTYPALFITRFVTHFCAPVFVFLAGTSAFLVGQRKGKKNLSIWLLKRGTWLILVEFTIIKLAWNFQLDYSINLLQVIWILGLSMLCLAAFIYVPKKIMITLSVLVIVAHNLTDGFSPQNETLSLVWTFFHEFKVIQIKDIQIFVGYPIIPWIFVMPLGYHFGRWYLPNVAPEIRIKNLLILGVCTTLLFFVVRSINLYGDPYFWSIQPDFGLTLVSFFNITKYPPSFLYLTLTLGPSILFLAIVEKWKLPIQKQLVHFGRVPMFFYIVHIYLIHALGVIAAIATGFSAKDMVIDLWVTLQPNLQGYGFNLWVVYGVWVLVLLALYPICRWFDSFKSNNRQIWWLQYF